MTRDEKIAKARELKQGGMSYAAIGRYFGVTNSCVQKWLKPERAREWNRRQEARPERAAAKRQWEQEHDRRPCPRCGQLMGVGAHRNGTERCGTCLAADVAERRAQIIAGYKAGLPAWEIAEQTGIPENTVKTEACRLRSQGVDIPYGPTGGAAHREAA